MTGGVYREPLLPSQVFARLDQLYRSMTPQAFGSLMQRLLAAGFKGAGFEVINNPVGVPDFVASRSSEETLAVEVKTGNPVTLSERDLAGVTTPDRKGSVAFLIFPDIDPRWLFIDAHALAPGKWEHWQLRSKRQVHVGFDHKTALWQCLVALSDLTELGQDQLVRLTKPPQ